MLSAEDMNLYDEAEEFINKVGRIRNLQTSLWKKQIDGMNVSTKDNKRVIDCINEAIEDCFWEGLKNARRIMSEIDRSEK